MSRRTPDMDRDDLHTIADMSDVRRSPLFGFGAHDGRPVQGVTGSSHDINDELQSSEERLMVILGTLKAALSIGMVYIVGFGLAIALMLLIWR